MKLFRKPSTSSHSLGETAACDECSSRMSEVFCQQCDVRLCTVCDGQVHSSRVTRTHVRTPAAEGSKKPKPLPPPPGSGRAAAATPTPQESPEQIAKAKAALAQVEDALKREEGFQADLGHALREARTAVKQHFGQLRQALAEREEQLAAELGEVELLAAQRRQALNEAKKQLGTPGVRATEKALAMAAAAVSAVPNSCAITYVAEPGDVAKTVSSFGRLALGARGGRDYTKGFTAPKRVFGLRGKGALTLMESPEVVRVDASDNIYVVDTGNRRVLVFSPSGAPLRQFVPDDCVDIDGLAFDRSGNLVLVHGFQRKVRVYGPDGASLLEFGTLQRSHNDVPGQFRNPKGINIDSSGRFLVLDKEKSRVVVFEPDASFLTQLGYSSGSGEGQFHQPEGLTLTPSGDIVVVDSGNHRIHIFSGEDWSLIRTFGSEGDGPGQFYYPQDAAVDAMGNIIVADLGNSRIVICAPDGTFITSFGTRGDAPGQLQKPYGVAVNSQGHIIVLDRTICRVQIW